MSSVAYLVRDRIGEIVIDRPEKKNALTAAMYQSLAEAIGAAGQDPAVRALFLHGSARCFSAGNDLQDFLSTPHAGDDSPVARFLVAIASAEKPIVAAVGGPAVGIGTTMLLHCDLVYCTPEARFQLPFVSLGLVPEAASSFLLPRMAGYHRAAELLLLGRPFPAEKARECGIVTDVVPEAELLDHARAAALALAGLPPASVCATKRLMKQREAPAVSEQMILERNLFQQRLRSPEAREAMSAFLEKRAPDFSRF